MKEHRADWMSEGVLGLMVHYLVGPSGDPTDEKIAEYNALIDGFDLDAFVDGFEATGANWLIFTFGQNSGYYCSPNAFLDAAAPGHTSRRDLMREVGERLKAVGKRLIAYIPAEVAAQTDEIRGLFHYDDGWDLFQERYGQFIRDYSVRLGPLLDGWWFDGCYYKVHGERTDWRRWCENARAGNSDSVVALNEGGFCDGKTVPPSRSADYHAGEVHMLERGKIRMDFLPRNAEITTNEHGYYRAAGAPEPELYLPESLFIHGLQWHALVPVDCTFNPPTPDLHYSDEELITFVRSCTNAGGAVTFNLPITSRGIMPEKSVGQIGRVRAAIT